MRSILKKIYGQQQGNSAFARINKILEKFVQKHNFEARAGFSQQDIILITYGDTLIRKGEAPLQTLAGFLDQHVQDAFSSIHILPFFPFSSDDGFSVTDFFSVRKDLGSWADINHIGSRYKLMVDLVINHVSARSDWFAGYLAGANGFKDLAIEVDPHTDLSMVTRPRALPLLTAYEKQSGQRVDLWTTFSADQIDLNYQSLEVLEKIIQALLHYISQGACIIRLDAIAYLWKEIGTACIHLPQTHHMVCLLRMILDRVAPHAVLITETNVPHEENIRYFGNGYDQAQMVYNFTLPPLLLHALITESADLLSKWTRTLSTPSSQTTFLNFTASHDGIGVRPLEGILTKSELDRLAEQVIQNGGKVSLRQAKDDTHMPYEFNITYFDALKNPYVSPDFFHVARFLAAQAVALVMPGVPAVYIHSLLGSRNWYEGVTQTGQARTINRQKLSADTVTKDLADPRSVRAQIFHPYLKMIRIRINQPAFHPSAAVKVLDLDNRVFAVKRKCSDQIIYALSNLSGQQLTVSLPTTKTRTFLTDILTERQFFHKTVSLAPYEILWLDLRTRQKTS